MPTQLITELVQTRLHYREGDELKGMIYPSLRNDEAISWVLFFDNDGCPQDDGTSQDDKWPARKHRVYGELTLR